MKIAQESELLKPIRINLPAARRVIAFAPHPDDEVFGCGGTLCLMKKNGATISIHIITDGARGTTGATDNLVEKRQRESLDAARILDLPDPHFWGIPDRQLTYEEALIQKIQDHIVTYEADLVLLPAISELHPDHQSLALVGIEALRRLQNEYWVAFYEVSAMLPGFNQLVDITSVENLKKQAMACFATQLQQYPYDQRISGLNHFRTISLPADICSAEAFLYVSSRALKGRLELLFDGPVRRRQCQGYAVQPEDIPLVTVIVRSMSRKTLEESLDSLSLQTYSNIEVLLVNAKGGEHSEIFAQHNCLVVRLLNQGGNPLGRARAANLGLQHSHGDYICFLDDDDTLEPEHLQNLVEALQREADPLTVVYSAVQGLKRSDSAKNQLAVFAEPGVDFYRLLLGNIIPIHAVLFPAALLRLGLTFDESLDVYEDWDFWLQAARISRFVYVEKMTANYFLGGDSGVSPLRCDAESAEKARHEIIKKWLNKITPNEFICVSNLYHARQSDYDTSLSFHLSELNNSLKEKDKNIEQKKQELEQKKQELEQTKQELEQTNQKISELQTHLRHTFDQLEAIYKSTSWRILSPARFVVQAFCKKYSKAHESHPLAARLISWARSGASRWGRILYRRLPVGLRDPLVVCAFRLFGPLFVGERRYQQWRNSGQQLDNNAHEIGGSPVVIADIRRIPASEHHCNGSVAIHAHIYYADLAKEFFTYLDNMSRSFDLYVSVPNANVQQQCVSFFASLAQVRQLVVEIVPNRGRDLAPLFCTFGSRLKHYDYLAHIHTKKSLYNNGSTSGWRTYLLDNLFGSPDRIDQILGLLSNDDNFGVVYPQNYAELPYIANSWLANLPLAQVWSARLGLTRIPHGYFDFPAGSMFWARTEALMPLFESTISLEDFVEEHGQTDGTLAHCLERFLVLIAQHTGFRALILKDIKSPSWSRWRFDQYLSRTLNGFEAFVSTARIELVIFDIFDTLLVKSLLEPEDSKQLVALRAGENIGSLYAKWRVEAEIHARQKKRLDVATSEIFDSFAQITKITPSELTLLTNLEEDIETRSVSPRPQGIQLLQMALSAKKRVVLASDMHLSRERILRLLDDNNVKGWDKLYLSSDIGLRKDTGELYRHILDTEKLSAESVLMIGDNERSDFQIPDNLGLATYHLLRPLELAKALPRLAPIIDDAVRSTELDNRLTIGLIVQENFKNIFYENFYPYALTLPTLDSIGYSVLGPITLSFCQWLAKQTANDEINHLYFLSREGQFLKKVYDQYQAASQTTQQTHYLVLSRRAVTVPTIKTIEDVLNIARKDYFPASIENFLRVRFGLELSEQRWQDIYQAGLWKKGFRLEIRDSKIQQIIPLLNNLFEEICQIARDEEKALKVYLSANGLSCNAKDHAFVDVGYSATIQSRMNHLIQGQLHGYYLATWEEAEGVSKQQNVNIQGCFGQFLKKTENHALRHDSFLLERLLSSNDAQVCRYITPDQVTPQAVYLNQGIEEKNAVEFREKLQDGALRFVHDALKARQEMYPAFTIPTSVALQLYSALVQDTSPIEKQILSTLVLDDFYCGRGLVN